MIENLGIIPKDSTFLCRNILNFLYTKKPPKEQAMGRAGLQEVLGNLGLKKYYARCLEVLSSLGGWTTLHGSLG